MPLRAALQRLLRHDRRPAPLADEQLRVMKREWDDRARENAMHYIVTDRDDWTLEDFIATGRDAVEKTIFPDLELICGTRSASDLRVLEIGCGIGRMTRPLAGAFGEVHAVDVSREMVRRAREQLADVPNAFVYETDGATLPMFDDGSFDFAYSFIVFQHIPYRDAVVSYLREVRRTLRPGGVFKFQAQGVVLPGERDTWVGVGFTATEMHALAEELDFVVLRQEGGGTQYFWNLWRRKPVL